MKIFVTPAQAEEIGALVFTIARAKANRDILDSHIRIYVQDDKFCRSCGVQTPDFLLPELPDFEEGSNDE